MNRAFALLFVLALASSCDDSTAEDAGFADAGSTEARRDTGSDASRDASPDASSPDTGRLDAAGDVGFGDAEAPDATLDAAEPDAEVDAGEADSGDSGEVDAEVDAGAADAGEVDAGPLVCPTTCQITTPKETIPTIGLALWLRADRGVNVGPSEAVCLWCDLSGSGHDMLAFGVPIRLPSAAGGQPAVQSGAGAYVGRGDLLNIPTTAGRTFVAVSRLRTLSARTQPIGQGQGGTPGTYVQIDANTFSTPGARFGVYVTNNAYSANTLTSTQATLHVMRLDSLQAGVPVLSELEYFVNGSAQLLTRTNGGLGNTNIESFANANYTAVGTSASLHEISEVLVYDRALTEPERAQLEAYLSARYGL
jgi:hypothetical protein